MQACEQGMQRRIGAGRPVYCDCEGLRILHSVQLLEMLLAVLMLQLMQRASVQADAEHSTGVLLKVPSVTRNTDMGSTVQFKAKQ